MTAEVSPCGDKIIVSVEDEAPFATCHGMFGCETFIECM